MVKLKLTEKYKPKRIKDIKGQKAIVLRMKNLLKRGIIPHMLLMGKPGTGKTTAAEVFVNHFKKGNVTDYNFRKYNSSNKRGIDFVRELDKLSNLQLREKVFVLLDEADGMTPEALDAMRNMMVNTKSIIFILTANFETKVIDAIKSRCTIFRFSPLDDEDVLEHLIHIFKKEKITVELTEQSELAIESMIDDADGDLRWLLNSVESLINDKNVITEKSLLTMSRARRGRILLQKAVSGDFETAREMLKKAHASGEGRRIMEDWYKTIPLLKIKNEEKIILYDKLGDCDIGLRGSMNPLIQLTKFLAIAWIIRFVPLNPIVFKTGVD